MKEEKKVKNEAEKAIEREREYADASANVADYELDINRAARDAWKRLKDDFENKPFLFVLKVILQLVAMVISVLRPPKMGFFETLFTAIRELRKQSAYAEMARIEMEEERNGVEGGVPMDIFSDSKA